MGESKPADIVLVTAPGDGETGIGDYTNDLFSHAGDIAVETVELPIQSTNPLDFLRPAIQVGRTESTVIHIQHEYGMFGPMSLMTWIFFPVVFVLSSINDTPVVVSLHEALNEDHIAEPLAPLKRVYISLINHLLTFGADEMVFLSDTTKSEFTQSVAPEDSSVVPHGVSTDRTVELSKQEAKERLGYSPDETVIIEPGYIEPRKGSKVFVALAERMPEYEFLIAGGVTNPAYREYGDQVVNTAPENLRVTGVMDEEMFHTAFCAADLAVLPYQKTEQSGIVNTVGQSGIFNRCVAYELPVLGSKQTYFEKLEENWGCVETFSTDDLDQATQRIQEILTDETKREQLSTAMAEYANANSFDQAVEEHKEIYQEVAARSSNGRSQRARADGGTSQ